MNPVSRRNFLTLSAIAAAGPSATLATGCGEKGDAGDPDPKAELRALNYALWVELSSVAVYGAGARLLSGRALEAAELFAAQEREHADALADAIEGLGGTPTSPRGEETYRERLGLDRLRDEDDFLNLAVDLENTAIAVYDGALPMLGSPELRSTVFEIVAVEAQHLSVVLGELGEPQVPDPFVVGAQTLPRRP